MGLTSADELMEGVEADVDEASSLTPKGSFYDQFIASLLGNTDPYMQVGEGSDVSNVNPYTQGFMDLLMGTPFDSNSPFTASDDVKATPGLIDKSMGEAFAQEGSQARMYQNAIQALIGGDRTNALAEPAFTQADLGMRDAVNATSKMYSSKNALYSGAATDTATRAAMEARNSAILPYMQQYGQMGQAAQQGGQGFLSNLLGMGGAMSGQEYFQPSYAQNPGFVSPLQAYSINEGLEAQQLQTIMGGLGAGGNVLATILGSK